MRAEIREAISSSPYPATRRMFRALLAFCEVNQRNLKDAFSTLRDVALSDVPTPYVWSAYVAASVPPNDEIATDQDWVRVLQSVDGLRSSFGGRTEDPATECRRALAALRAANALGDATRMTEEWARFDAGMESLPSRELIQAFRTLSGDLPRLEERSDGK